ncbi:MAG: 50S ribosome-binding GTPase [Planctomycetaceae bacterium]|nr:50S ribosome-binding GTPase [Planctomycetaceae bacterium]
MAPLRECAALCRRLHDSARRLEGEARWLRLAPLAGREWFELLRGKLVPQLTDDAFLIAAVVGGTNIGKSVVFNHLAGVRASATSPLASGTKHPVCLVPPGFESEHNLSELFDGFHLEEWSDAEAALRESNDDELFWRTNADLPPNLLVLDTPDIDSDAKVNWARADKIRRAADVLVAILTQQKYNDAAVKAFFRHAAAEDKAVVIVFNQCVLPEDEAYWPLWVGTFCRETGIVPELVYLAPADRNAAESMRLPFYERRWPIEASEGRQNVENFDTVQTDDPEADAPGSSGSRSNDEPRSLREDLSRLHFDEVKLRSLRGSLRQLIDDRSGAPAWLAEVAARSDAFRGAAEHVSAERVVEVHGWPVVPFSLVFEEFWSWWKGHRTGWTRNVTTFYDTVNKGVSWPFRAAREAIRGPEVGDPIAAYRATERDAVLRTAEEVFSKLKLLGDAGGELIRPHFERLATGEKRAELIEFLKREHEASDVRTELRELIANDMRDFLGNRPEVAGWLKKLDLVAVGSRPALSVLLFAVGAHGAEVAAQGLVNVAVDLFAGTAATAAGDTLFTKAAGNLGAAIFARLRAVPDKFAARRAAWLASRLKEHLLGTLPEDLQVAAHLPQSEAFREVEATIEELRRVLSAELQPATIASR